MANEITLNASLAYADADHADESLEIVDLLVSIGTKKYIKHSQTIGTSEEAVVLGEVSAPGYGLFINRDATNYIELRVATSGAKFAKMLPGEFALLRLGSGAQAPFAIADTGSCKLEFFLLYT